MKRGKLISNIIDQMKEAQLKLGYAKERVRLYYPVESLRAILETDINSEELLKSLQVSFQEESILGKLTFAIQKDGRIEICVPPEGAQYVKEMTEPDGFLVDLIELFRDNHTCSLEAIEHLFAKYDKGYKCQKMPEGSDFDYVFYFSEGTVDGYYYCVKQEMGHMIYHRFTKEDYERL